jgi:hypothetical protein
MTLVTKRVRQCKERTVLRIDLIHMDTHRVRHTDYSYPCKPVALTHTDLLFGSLKNHWVGVESYAWLSSSLLHKLHIHTPPPTTLPVDVIPNKYWSPRIRQPTSRSLEEDVADWRFFAVGTVSNSPYSYSIHGILFCSAFEQRLIYWKMALPPTLARMGPNTLILSPTHNIHSHLKKKKL